METESPGASLEQGCRPESGAGERMVYAGYRNGSVVAWVLDDPKFRDDTAERVSDFIQRGLRVERMSWSAAFRAMDATLKTQVGTPSSETLSR